MPKITILFYVYDVDVNVALYTPVSHAQSLSSKQTMVNQQNQNNTTTQFSGNTDNTKKATTDDEPSFENSKVNQYIIQHHLQHSHVVNDPRMDTLPKLEYKNGTYIGVVIHEVGKTTVLYKNGLITCMQHTIQHLYMHSLIIKNTSYCTFKILCMGCWT